MSNWLLSAESLSYNLNMRKLILIILIVLFSALYYYSNTQPESSILHKSIAKMNLLAKNSTSATQVATDAKPEEATAPVNPEKYKDLQVVTAEELKKWLASESQSLNSTHNDSDEQQIRFRAQAQTLKPLQLQLLTLQAIDSTLPVNERIFSAYMIGLNTLPESQSSLFEVAQSEIPDRGPIVPHSEAELKHTQELAIRYMEIDELYERAKTDGNARDKLKLLMLEARSAQVRSYAEKKLKELK